MRIEYKPLTTYTLEETDYKNNHEVINVATEYFNIELSPWEKFKDWINKLLWNKTTKYANYVHKITQLIEAEYNEKVNNEKDVLYHQHINDIHYIIYNSPTIKSLIKHGVDDSFLEQRVSLIMFHVKAEICRITLHSNNPRGYNMCKQTELYQAFYKKYIE